MSPSKDPSTKCRRLNRKGLPCGNPKGHGTDHPGTGACSNHGGSSAGAPKGNKNALATGEYETIHVSALTEAERGLYESLDVQPRAQVEGQIRLLSVREHRILLRIKRIEEDDVDGFGISSVTTHNGWNVKGKVDFSVVERTTTLDTVQRLEDALTRVQAQKLKAVDQLRAILKENPPDSGGLDAIVQAINRSAQKIAAEKEADS